MPKTESSSYGVRPLVLTPFGQVWEIPPKTGHLQRLLPCHGTLIAAVPIWSIWPLLPRPQEGPF